MPTNINPWNSWNTEPTTLQGQPAIKPFSLQKPAPTPFSQMQRPSFMAGSTPEEYPWWQRMMGFGAKYMPTEEWLPKVAKGLEYPLYPFAEFGMGRKALDQPWYLPTYKNLPASYYEPEEIKKRRIGGETYQEYQELPWTEQLKYEAPAWLATAFIPGATQARAALAPATAGGGIRGGAAVAGRAALAPLAAVEKGTGILVRGAIQLPIKGVSAGVRKTFNTALNMGLDKWMALQGHSGIYKNRIIEYFLTKNNAWLVRQADANIARNLSQRIARKQTAEVAARMAAEDTIKQAEPLLLQATREVKPLELPARVKPTPPTKPIIPETMITPPPAVKGVPMTITGAMEGQLGKMGYSASAIAKMTPEEAWNILYKPTIPKAEVGVPEVKPLTEIALNEQLLGMSRTDYYILDNGHVIEAPTYPTSAEVLTLEELRELSPDTILTAKFYSAKRGGVARHKIKAGRIILPTSEVTPTIPKAEVGAPEAVAPVAGAVTSKVTAPVIEAKATNDQLAEAYNIAKSKLYINPKTNKPKPQYLRVAKSITGKTDIAKMTEAEAGEFIEALKRLPRPSYKQGKLVPPTIPITKRVTPENYFDITFKEPTIAKYLTSQTYYAQKLGVKPLVEPLELGKQRLDLVFQAMKNAKDQKISQIDKIGGTTAAQKIRAKVKNEPTEAVARMRDLLDTYEEAPAFLTTEERELFNWIRNLTRTIIDGENQVYRLLGMDEIPYRQAYIPHRANLMAEEILAGNHPLPNALSYWSSRIVGKKIFNQAEMQRQLAGDLENLFSKDLNYLLDSMLWTGLKVIHLSQPLNSFTQQMGAFDKDLPQYKDLPPEELARLKSISVMPASTKSWVIDYVNQVIKGQQTFLDAEINRLVTQSGIGGLIDKALRPFGRTLGQRPVTQLSKFIGRLMIFSVMGPRPGLIRMIGRNFLQATQDLALYPIKANLKGYLPATENLKRMQSKSLYLRSYTGLEELPPGVMSKAERAGLKPYRLSAVFNYSRSQRKAYWASLDLVENPKYRELGWADPQRTYTEPREFVYPSEDAKISYEMDFGPGATQYQYIGMAMPEIFRHKTLIPLTRLQSWWMNHFFRFHAEAMNRAFKGTTSYGAKIPWSWRLNYLKYLILGGAILTSLGYTSSYLAGVLPRSQSPAAQFIMGLYQYVTSDSEWEQSKAKRQIYNSWRAMVPGALTYKEFNDIWTGERPLWTAFFYGKAEAGPPPHKPSWGIPALLPKDPYQRIEDEVWSQYPGSVRRLSDRILKLEKTDPREARRLLFENPQVGSQILEARRKIAIAKAKLKREEAIEEREKIIAGR